MTSAMADPLLGKHPPTNANPNPNPIISQADFDGLPIPPLDPLFFSSQHHPTYTQDDFDSDLPSPFDDNYDFDITFDDVNVDDLFLPPDTELRILPHQTNDSGLPVVLPDGCVDNFIPDPASSGSGSSGISRDRVSDIEEYLNCSPSDAGSCDSGGGSSTSAGIMNSGSPVSSQGSRNAGSGLLKGMAATSPDYDNFVIDQRIEELSAKNDVPKRKKEGVEDGNGEIRNRKHRRSDNSVTNTFVNNASSHFGSFGALSEEEEKRRARLMRNRESAQLSRQRKKHYVEELEDKVRAMHSTIVDLKSKISFFAAENASLRQQLSGNGMCPAPMYPPMLPVAYPWVPCPPYAVKPQGSQVPLVPIPRLKPLYPVSASKNKKVENKKAAGKTKKVASVSFLGLLFFIMLFGGFVPIVNVKFGGVKESGIYSSHPGSEKLYDQQRGRVFVVNGHTNASRVNMGVRFPDGKFDIIGNTKHFEGSKRGCSQHEPEMKGGSKLPGSDESIRPGNSGEPLFASLFVPRNDKLVKIDGNLIIHSVLASDRAIASSVTSDANKNKETGLAISRDFSPALALPDAGGRHPHLYQHPEQQRALTSGPGETLKDNLKLSAANGKMQEWFREGLAGPMLSSGLCTEVFQFDVSSTAGAIIPASSVANITGDKPHNTTHPNKGRNRRILRGLPVPLQVSSIKISGEHARRNSQKRDFQGNKSVSSTVVSVLVDPREVGDNEVDGMIRTKSLSRIFVVVFLDSVKYVTYSCVLPHASSHLVTT